MSEIIAQRQSLLEALPQVKTAELTNHGCPHCHNIVIDSKTAYWIQTLPYDVDQALQAAVDGCTWYAWLMNQLRNSGKPAQELDRDRFALDFSYKDSAVDGAAMWDVYSITVLVGTESYRWPCAQFDVLAEASSAAAVCVSTRPINPCVASESSFKVAKQWIANCLDGHRHCRLHLRGILPNRVLNVAAGNDLVRLYETTQNVQPSSTQYVALSYCWGGDQPEKTTTANLSQYKAGILTATLPQSIQDAIQVTQRLGVRFLWVDSLCIVQDDPQDVTKEISQMPEYYENSLVTICATGSSGCTQGFLQRRPTVEYLTGPFKLRYRCPDGSTGLVSLVQHPSFSPADEVINSRGWVLQESLLSTRLLSYGTQNLRWSCLEDAWSDGGPWGIRNELDIRMSWTDWRLKYLSDGVGVTTNESGAAEKPLMDYWKMIVENYTHRRLTEPDDKLSALSGIARRYHDALSRPKPSKYLAGLFWPKEIVRQLLWVPVQKTISNSLVNSPPSRPKRFEIFQAPSWSWASLDGAVEHAEWEFVPADHDRRAGVLDNLGWTPEYSRAEVVDSRVEPLTQEAPFSTVKSAVLFIHGRMISAFPDKEEFDLMPDTEEDRTQMDQAISADQLVLLQLTRTGMLKGNVQIRPRGLMLVEDGKVGGAYRRIGTFRLRKAVTVSRDSYTYFDGVEPQQITLI